MRLEYKFRDGGFARITKVAFCCFYILMDFNEIGGINGVFLQWKHPQCTGSHMHFKLMD